MLFDAIHIGWDSGPAYVSDQLIDHVFLAGVMHKGGSQVDFDSR